MNQKSIKLEGAAYEEYLAGKEVVCVAAQLNTRNLREGDRILVYRDTVGNNTDASLPKREMQSEYIGVEGMVTSLRHHPDGHDGVIIKKV